MTGRELLRRLRRVGAEVVTGRGKGGHVMVFVERAPHICSDRERRNTVRDLRGHPEGVTAPQRPALKPTNPTPRGTALDYPVQLDPEPGCGFTVSLPDFCTPQQPGGGGYSSGATREEALVQAADLLETIIANHMAENWDIPAPSPAGGRPLGRLHPLTAIKVDLYRSMRAEGLTKAELARRIGIAPQQVQRLFDTNHASWLDQLEAAFAALGRRLVVASEAAASFLPQAH